MTEMSEPEKLAVRVAALERIVLGLWLAAPQKTRVESLKFVKNTADDPPKTVPDHWIPLFRWHLQNFVDSFEDPDLILRD